MIFNTMTIKRSREEADRRGDDMTTMANYLMLLSGATVSAAAGHHQDDEYSRVFTCKTCNRQFSSFQALGGHRASHKKPRLLAGGAGDGALPQPASPPKPKTHECSVCGLEFPIGQALGGHMRRHRAAATTTADDDRKQAETALSLSTGPPPAAIVKKAANNSRRVLCMDLNLTPLENKFVFGKIAPAAVDCFF